MLNKNIIFVIYTLLLISCNKNINEFENNDFAENSFFIRTNKNKLRADFYNTKQNNLLIRSEYLDDTDSLYIECDSIIYYTKEPNIKYLKFHKFINIDTCYFYTYFKNNKIIKIDTMCNYNIFSNYYDSLQLEFRKEWE
jgi:hypothetical protein